jgi:ribose transport system substrate-binding protein
VKTLKALAFAATLAASTSLATAQEKGLVAFSQAGMENEWRVMNTKEME